MLSAIVLAATLSAVAHPGSGPLPALRSELAGLPAVSRVPSRAADDDEPGRARIPAASTASTKPAKPRSAPPQAAVPRPTRVSELVEEPELEPPSRSKVAPVLVLGGSIVAGIVGAVFFSRALAAIDEEPAMRRVGSGATSVLVPDEDAIRAQQEEVLTNGVISMVSFSGAIAGLVTSSLLLVAD